ncbi:hypothetical protein BDN70DRAFT_887694 [Pholiota conissans]|uniref:Uncharacterized protein n=1 Tax=Pholiota conissans TaxID=109636 RepID=A0A9P6CMJ6_9AGAR|nr:hypothetical protein BDN70DRAFT_887694 [Pholiota conissans]
MTESSTHDAITKTRKQSHGWLVSAIIISISLDGEPLVYTHDSPLYWSSFWNL